mmetsp:Transcript_10508/g.20713  ORF Transcript_10508/g.20713 Transcript_10508/m.20713 type:complete len:156 (-) Transcript_10508:438-905(-)|eukprot:CAMPEP_0171485566 /NCGR_PEP_ID=MMETSP0958-20121227/615_1 /TAXON_ID=87120 /ORGANISM="Aurantiochytrium limacinum, Strain ATCCMYA-1381" /LENGTH=155 /DNA_ID=CAMNT_0012018367 /DNA_START=322 /DNA_END=789 /DNA_ORIENTATION=-
MACYLTFDVTSLGTLYMTWSEEPIEDALAVITPSKPVPKFKFRLNGGRSEVIRKIRDNKRMLFRGWCEFIKTARDTHGTFEVLPAAKEHEAAQVRVYFNCAGEVEACVEDGSYIVYDYNAVAVVHRDNSSFKSVKTMQQSQFLDIGLREGYSLLL